MTLLMEGYGQTVSATQGGYYQCQGRGGGGLYSLMYVIEKVKVRVGRLVITYDFEEPWPILGNIVDK